MIGKKDCSGCYVCVKLAIVALVIIVLKLWSSAMNWVNDTNIWWFVVALIIFIVCPMFCRCKNCNNPTKKAPIKKRKK